MRKLPVENVTWNHNLRLRRHDRSQFLVLGHSGQMYTRRCDGAECSYVYLFEAELANAIRPLVLQPKRGYNARLRPMPGGRQASICPVEEDSMASASKSADRVNNYFVGYVCDRFSHRRHIRRVVGWVGMLLKAIERVSGGDFELSRKRQVVLGYRNDRFKARFRHDVGSRGGIQIVEVLPLQGNPIIETGIDIRSLDEASEVCDGLERLLDAYIDK